MKKLFTLAIAMLLASAVSSQAQTLYYGEREVTNGETITIGYDESNPLSFLSYVWDFDLFLDLPSSSSFTITVSTSPACTTEDYIQVCGTGGCEVLNNGTSHSQTTPTAYNAGKYPMQIERFFDKFSGNEPTERTVKVEIKAGMRTFTVNFVCKPYEAGISSVTTAGKTSYVSANGRTLNYNLPKGHLTLFALTGARVMDIKVAGGQGSASLAGLRQGVYLYRSGSLSGKILVK